MCTLHRLRWITKRCTYNHISYLYILNFLSPSLSVGEIFLNSLGILMTFPFFLAAKFNILSLFLTMRSIILLYGMKGFNQFIQKFTHGNENKKHGKREYASQGFWTLPIERKICQMVRKNLLKRRWASNHRNESWSYRKNRCSTQKLKFCPASWTLVLWYELICWRRTKYLPMKT